jgi:hypothetical protein
MARWQELDYVAVHAVIARGCNLTIQLNKTVPINPVCVVKMLAHGPPWPDWKRVKSAAFFTIFGSTICFRQTVF